MNPDHFLLAKPYNYDYDLYIIDMLFEEEKLGFRQMKKIIYERKNIKISFDALNYHLKKLKGNGYIKIHNNYRKRGQKADYCLTDRSKQEIDLGILELNYDKPQLRIQNIIDSKRQIYYKILCIISIKPPLLVYNHEYEDNPGVTIKDLSNEIPGILGFWYIKLDEQKIKKALSYLEKEGLVKKIKNKDDDEYRYVTFDILGNFVSDCMQIFENLVFLRFSLLWNTIRPSKFGERKIFEALWDKESINSQIIFSQKVLQMNKKEPDYKNIVKRNKESIDYIDYNVYEHIKQLENKYYELYTKYPSITCMILDTYFPQFYIDEIKKIHSKYPNKKYPRALMAGPFYDSVTV